MLITQAWIRGLHITQTTSSNNAVKMAELNENCHILGSNLCKKTHLTNPKFNSNENFRQATKQPTSSYIPKKISC